MKINQISQLLGLNVSNQNKKEALEICNNLLLKIIQLFRSQPFGILTFYGINTKNMREHSTFLENVESYLSTHNFNFIKISVQWNIKFKDVLNFTEIGYFIINPTFEDMILMAKKFDQSLFVYSKESNTNVYYSDGTKIQLEKDTYKFGEIASNALILNFVDFKLFIDKVLDYRFNFLKQDEINIDDRIVVFSKSKFTFDTYLTVIDVHDIRQNGIISFERSKKSPAISPKVFHFDEIVWAIKLTSIKVNNNLTQYKNVV
ncbi:MAG: hypothetical protein N3F03_03315 [Ignavibacteria bacterium]|nr:hypothetical protein [Ignavibacteria bacterium]